MTSAMKSDKNVVTNADNTIAIYLDKSVFGYRLKKADRNLAGEWCNSFKLVEVNLYKTLKAAKQRATEILAQA